MRYRPKSKTSFHSKQRFEQRYEGEEDIEVIASRVRHYGIFVHQIPHDNPLHDFMECKIMARNKKVKLLNGYVYVFALSDRLITMYPIPDEYKEAYGEIAYIEKKNKEKWKAKKDRRQSRREK